MVSKQLLETDRYGAGVEKAGVRAGYRFWLELREPGCSPVRKGSWALRDMARVLREFMEARPRAFITVITVDADGHPDLQDGPEALMVADGRSIPTARRHWKTTRAAFPTLTTGGTDD